MLIVKKMDEISTTISYHEEKHSAKVSIRGIGNYSCVPKCKNTQYKAENGIQSNIGIVFFRFPESSSNRK